MAVLNFATSYSDVSSKLSLAESTKGDYIKLYFTKDGHIITHGVDYIPWGNGIIPISKLPVDNNSADSSHIWDSKTIQDKINASFTANDAMRFKGTIAQVNNSTTYTINGTNTTFPTTSAQVGDTYRVTATGTYGGHRCEVGDLLICITTGSKASDVTWTVAQTNINGEISHWINGVPRDFYSNDSESFTIFAPTSGGAQGQFLVATGAKTAPKWLDPSGLTVGTANKVTGTLSTTGSGLTMSASYNGSANVTIKLNPATTGALGGVIIDNATNPTISVDSTGKIYLTSTNIVNALGYNPAGVNNWRVVKVNGTEALSSDTGSGALDLANGSGILVSYDTTNKKVKFTANTNYTTTGKNYKVQVDSTTGGLYVNVPWANTTYGVVSSTADGLAPKVISTNTGLVSAAYYVLASTDGKTTPSWYKLPATAFSNTWRTIQINGTSIGNNTLNLVPGDKISMTNTDGKVVISSSWRTISIGGTSIGNKALNFMPSGDIYVKTGDQDSTTDAFDVGFGLAWYNVNNDQYEYE